jgi:hypothetical protein
VTVDRHRAPPKAVARSLASEAETRQLAADIAGVIRPGDWIALSGDLGAGKSTFARALIRALAGDPELEAPSPTFTLMQSYDTPRGAVVHADLYRLASPEEVHELGLAEALEEAIGLVEWPDRLNGLFDAARRLDVHLALLPDGADDERHVTLTPGDAWADRLPIVMAARRLIDRAGWGEAAREPMQGDASTRAYERLRRPNGETAILMISPPRADGPPVKAGKPYSAIARLAERVDAFVAIDKGLIALGLSAPVIHAADFHTGLLITEDLGAEGVLSAGVPIPERYEAAVEALAAIHAETLPTILPVAEGRDHVIPDYDVEALTIEVELLPDWYVAHAGAASLTMAARADFLRAWTPLFEEIAQGPRTWVLRDVHSPNLIWLPAREGLARVGLIDFQDAVMGHPAYDVVSLAQDARVDVDPALELRLVARYASARRAADPAFDMAGFARAYAILGAQRATKILGIFARLNRRDGKPGYLKHMPRMEAYLRRDLAHPALIDVRAWFQRHLPGLMAEDGSNPPS